MADFSVAKKAFKNLPFIVKDVPTSKTIVSAKFMIKTALSVADASASVTKTITTSPDSNGAVSDTGADGTGQIDVYIQETDLNALTAGTAYYYALKVFLSDNEGYMLKEFRGVFLVTEAGVEATS